MSEKQIRLNAKEAESLLFKSGFALDRQKAGDTLHPKIIKELPKAIEDYVFAANTGFARISA